MTLPVCDLATLLRSMRPVLNEGVFAYAVAPPGARLEAVQALATFRESEGLTVIAPEADVLAAGWPVLFRTAWITLQVHSDLQAVGFTAAFSHALADAGIGCNVVAAVHHDHVFVPWERADEALAVLRSLGG